jgi:hypothetical protein
MGYVIFSPKADSKISITIKEQLKMKNKKLSGLSDLIDSIRENQSTGMI